MTARAHARKVIRGVRLREQGITLRNTGFRELIEDGLNPRQAAELIEDEARRAGLTDEQIRAAGISEWNVRKVVSAD